MAGPAALLRLPASELPAAVASLLADEPPRVAEAMRFFDESLEGRDHLAGEAFSAADILLLTTLDFAKFVGLDMPGECATLAAWHERVSARPSASA